MPCPFFYPTQPVAHPAHPGARLPLIQEFQGSCHACDTVVPAPADGLFSLCNHGYSRGECVHFPPDEVRSCLRYSVIGETSEFLEILWVEEQDHKPVKWDKVRYRIATGTLSDELSGCMRAQVEAFGRSYLSH